MYWTWACAIHGTECSKQVYDASQFINLTPCDDLPYEAFESDKRRLKHDKEHPWVLANVDKSPFTYRLRWHVAIIHLHTICTESSMHVLHESSHPVMATAMYRAKKHIPKWKCSEVDIATGYELVVM